METMYLNNFEDVIVNPVKVFSQLELELISDDVNEIDK